MSGFQMKSLYSLMHHYRHTLNMRSKSWLIFYFQEVHFIRNKCDTMGNLDTLLERYKKLISQGN